MIASALMLVVAVTCFSFLISAETATARDGLRSAANDQARLAEQEIDRQVRSGNLLYDPSTEAAGSAGPACTPAATPSSSCVAPGYSLRIYTQANGAYRCVQWRVLNSTLQSRSWNESGTGITSWATIADHIANVAASTTPFARDPGSAFGGRLLNVDLVVNEGARSGNGAEVKLSVTGRNTEFGYPTSVCANVPAP